MSLIKINQLCFTYSGEHNPVFQTVNLNLETEWRLGFIGRNGRGKSTFLKLLNGDLACDSGSIHKSVSTEIFPFDYRKKYEKTRDLVKDNIGPYFELEKNMNRLLCANTEAAYLEYATLLGDYIENDGYEIDAMIEKECHLIGLEADLLDRPFETLSGGEQTKALMVALFLRKNHFLLLDEPTNHLDIEGRITMAKYLSSKTGFIVVSHDRKFLDSVVDHILAINKMSIQIEKGTFSTWDENRLMHETFELRTKARIVSEVQTLTQAAKQSRRFSHDKESEKKGAVDKGYVGARAARLMKRAKNIEKRRQKQLQEKKTLLKNYENVPQLIIKQLPAERNQLIEIQNVSFGFDQKALFKNFSLSVESGDRLWIKGKNGTGKSTILSIIRKRLTPTEGSILHAPDLIIAESYQKALWQYGNLIDHLQTNEFDHTIFRNILAYFEMYETYFERPLETFSEGELKKIDIARALATPHHLVILDEPLNYMDMYFRQQLESALVLCETTVIFVEHDDVFGNAVATKTLNLGKF